MGMQDGYQGMDCRITFTTPEDKVIRLDAGPPPAPTHQSPYDDVAQVLEENRRIHREAGGIMTAPPFVYLVEKGRSRSTMERLALGVGRSVRMAIKTALRDSEFITFMATGSHGRFVEGWAGELLEDLANCPACELYHVGPRLDGGPFV